MLHPNALRGLKTEDKRQQLIKHAPAENQAQIANLSAPDVEKLSTAVANVADVASTPGPAAAAAVGDAIVNSPVVAHIAMRLLATAEWAKWEEREDAMNPIGGIKRRKPFPVKLLPGQVAASAAGLGTLTMAPQEEFEGFRLVFPDGQLTATGDFFINQLLAGDRLLMAQSGRMPAACFTEKGDMGRIDFPIVKLGELISMSISGATSGATVTGVLFGYARSKSRMLPEGAEVLGMRYEPFDVTAVPPAGTATITLQPQRHIILRRLAFDDTVASFTNLSLVSLNVQDDPQYVSGFPIPLSLFSELAQDDWLDTDLCQLGGTITMVISNSNTSVTVTAQGMAVCDLVRLQGDPR